MKINLLPKNKKLLQEIWSRIVKETKEAQILSGPNKGLVKNFLINDFYYRESAFAATIFATEYIRTGNKEYLNRAWLALERLQKILQYWSNGLDEPMWTPRGIRYRKGSIPATIIFLYAIENASELVNYEIEYDMRSIIEYLEKCYLGKGRFYHDKVYPNKKYPSIINTTSMAYFFLEFARSKDIYTEFYKREIDKIKRFIFNSQREDGFFPYVEPKLFQKIIFKFRKFYPEKLLEIYNFLYRDNSVFFGDAIHHVVTLYYYLLGVSYRGFNLKNNEKKMLFKGFEFIRKCLKKNDDGSIYFDFSWEPKPKYLRYCNFRDTSTYFYLIDLIRLFKKFNLFSEDEYFYYIGGFIKYIYNNLLQDKIPAIKPYQQEDEIFHLIMPRPSESIFDKGFFLSKLLLEGEFNE